MRTKLIVVLVAAAVVAGGYLLLRDGSEDRSEEPDRGGGPPGRRHVEVTWPDELDAGDRAVLTPVVDGLAGDDAAVGEALAALRDEALIERFDDRRQPVLALLNPFLDEILRASADPLRRAVLGVLRDWLDVEDPVRREALAETVPLDAIAAAFGSSESEAFRREAVVLLGAVPGLPAAELLRRVLPHDDPVVRREALRTLARRKDPGAAALLARRLGEDSDPGVKAEILRIWQANAAVRPPNLRDLVRPLVDADETAVRVAAIELVGVTSDRGSFGALGNAIERGDRDTLMAAALALGRMGGPEAAALLEKIPDPGEADPKLSQRLAWARDRVR